MSGDNNRNGRKGGGRGHHRGPMIGMPVEKPKDFKGTLTRLAGYLQPYSLNLIIVLIAAIASTVFTILSPKVMGKAITSLFTGFMMHTGIDFPYITHIIFILAGLYLLSSLFAFIQQYIMAGVAQKTVYDQRRDLDIKLGYLPLKFYDRHTHGEILSRTTNDIDNISNTLQQSITQLITSVVTLIGVAVMMFTISPVLTLIVVATLPFYIFITKPIISRSQKYFKDRQKFLGELNGHVEEMYGGHKIIKAFSREEDSIKKFESLNQELYNVGWKAQFISGIIMPLMSFVNNIGYVLVSVIGAIFVTGMTLQIGDVQAFIQYTRQFTRPITQTANIANIIQSTVASAERVFEILDEGEEISDEDSNFVLENPEGKVEFKDVSFGYNDNVTVINDFTLKVDTGQTIAIVGPTGAGKTTLVNLLMRFYDIDAGKISTDNIDIRYLRRENLRSQFGMVLQDTWLFNGTIRDNIAYGVEEASEEDIVQSARTAQADHFIRTLPDGYDTVLNEEASNISQGQKQLLTIARVILTDPALLILDEATSNVDSRTEVYIQKAMNELMKGRTNFVIAHRLSTIRNADLILVLNKGDIVEQGNHEELLEKKGFYADLYYSQFPEVSVS